MKRVIFNALIYKLKTNPQILEWLGGPFVFRAGRLAPTQIPSITVRSSGERRHMRPCFTSIKTSIPNTILTMCSPSVEISIWVSSAHTGFPQTGEDADEIADYISELLLDSTQYVTGTHAWNQISTTQQIEETKNLWHNVLRFSLDYHIDTEGETVSIIDAGSPSDSGEE